MGKQLAASKQVLHSMQAYLDQHGQTMGEGNYLKLSEFSLQLHTSLLGAVREATREAVTRSESEASFEIDRRLAGWRIRNPDRAPRDRDALVARV